jgi:hypothetical protein
VEFEFDFRLYADCSLLTETVYFELAPDRYSGKCWAPGSRFLHEYTFCLFEGIFEKRAPGYDHFGFVEIPRVQWQLIIGDIVTLRAALVQAIDTQQVTLPYGSTLKVQGPFELALAANQRALAALLTDLEVWLRQTCSEHEVISVLGI